MHKFGVTAMLKNVLYGCIYNAVKLRKLNVWLVLEHVSKCLHVSVKVHPCCVQVNREYSTTFNYVFVIISFILDMPFLLKVFIFLFLALLTLDQLYKVGHPCLVLQF